MLTLGLLQRHNLRALARPVAFLNGSRHVSVNGEEDVSRDRIALNDNAARFDFSDESLSLSVPVMVRNLRKITRQHRQSPLQYALIISGKGSDANPDIGKSKRFQRAVVAAENPASLAIAPRADVNLSPGRGQVSPALIFPLSLACWALILIVVGVAYG